MIEFEPISFKYLPDYNKLYQQCEEKSYDNSFIWMWGWNNAYHFEWAFDENLCWIRYHWNGKIYYRTPVGCWQNCDWKKIVSEKLPPKAELESISEKLARQLYLSCGRQIKLREEPDSMEYIYTLSDLTELPGRKYHVKRQLANYFTRIYDYRQKEITAQDIPVVRDYYKKLFDISEKTSDSPSYDYNEKQALLRILDNWENLKPDISGSMLFVEDEIVAFIIGEKIDNDNLFIHFEKSSPGFRGVSQANNRLFLEQNNSVKYINFGQDFGLPELRRSMQENNPSGYIKKYYIYKVA